MDVPTHERQFYFTVVFNEAFYHRGTGQNISRESICKVSKLVALILILMYFCFGRFDVLQSDSYFHSFSDQFSSKDPLMSATARHSFTAYTEYWPFSAKLSDLRLSISHIYPYDSAERQGNK